MTVAPGEARRFGQPWPAAFYLARYDAARRASGGGGVVSDAEDIQVLELALDDSLVRVESGEIVDAKLVLLLQCADRNAPGRPC
jgi:GDP-mannose pyrophosphatase NudK